ncbi:MAG: HTH-type transcriptional regulator / antitoxin PezA [Euryarchaeota archaeon]|jgi:transcriptional regulator with XRE-family HTH domain|nr:HTH-type transcriptional regulator / antitoxin PezA [Euryarchaeota archaeon]
MITSKKALSVIDKLVIEEETLGNLIKNIRKCENITQAKFAKILDVKPQYLSDLENNKKIVSPRKAYEYAEKLGYLPEDFVRLALQDEANKSFKKLGYRVHLGINIQQNQQICPV